MACENCMGASKPLYPDVTYGRTWVAVQWDDCGPIHVLEEDGTVTERFTVPSDVAQLPLIAPAAKYELRSVRSVDLPGGAA